MTNVSVCKEDLQKLLDYCKITERNHYLEEPHLNHIYVTICKLKTQLKKEQDKSNELDYLFRKDTSHEI